MVRRILQGLLAIILATAGVTAAQTPAFAAVGGCTTNNVTLSSCVNYGDSGTNVVRADFYLNRPPDASIHHYYVYIVINGTWYSVGSGNFTGTGRYCCWYKTYDNLPNTYNSARTVIGVWTSWGALHMTVSSPTIYFWS